MPQVHAAMTAAGWTRADEVRLRSSWGIVVSVVLRRTYPCAPVSPLMLFGRLQAFAFEMEVGGNASERHHVRFWPTPPGWGLPGDHRVDWLAAGTFDRAVGLSLFTLQVTHKIDADTDVERDHVVSTCTVEAALLIHRASQFHGGHASLTSLLHAGASVVVLVTVSSDGARQWVAGRGR